MYRLAVVVVIALILSITGAVGLVGDRGADPAPAAPTSAPASLAPTDPDDIAAYVTSLQQRLGRLPEDAESWANLALAYVEQARVTGNPGFYTQAEQAVDRSLDVRPEDNATAHAAAAALAGARHQFKASLSAADHSLRINPFEQGALAVRVDALTELGRYREQMRALRTADRRQPGVPVAARYSYALELRGQLARAARVLKRAAATAQPADEAYLLTLLADLDRRRGLLEQSEQHLREALRLSPDQVATRVASARLAVARGQRDRALREWRQVVETLPLAEYLTEYGELFEFLGRPAKATEQYDVVETTNQLAVASGVNADLEVALFAADHGDPEAAVATAKAEWERRKSIHVADVYAWALHRAGDDRTALDLARTATRLDTDEARLWLHRGTIEAALGLDEAARKHLRRGLAVDPGSSPLQRKSAAKLLADLVAAR